MQRQSSLTSLDGCCVACTVWILRIAPALGRKSLGFHKEMPPMHVVLVAHRESIFELEAADGQITS